MRGHYCSIQLEYLKVSNGCVLLDPKSNGRGWSSEVSKRVLRKEHDRSFKEMAADINWNLTGLGYGLYWRGCTINCLMQV